MDPPISPPGFLFHVSGWKSTFYSLIFIVMVMMFQNASLMQRYDILTEVNFGQQPKRQAQEQTKARLWLITCETRAENPPFHLWMRSAIYVQNRSNDHRMMYHYNGDTNRSFVLDKVVVRNICQNKKYSSHRTKTMEVKNFLSSLPSMTNIHGEGYEQELDLVLFSDSDAVFNFNSVRADEVVQRFYNIVLNAQHEATHKDITVMNSVVITAESSCWIGMFDCSHVLTRYPLAANEGSNCPRFVNSGGYMGAPSALLPLMQYMLNLTDQDAVGKIQSSDQALMTTFYLNHHHYTPPPAQVEFRESRKASHIEDTKVVALLDRRAAIFRSLMVGFFFDENSTNSRNPWDPVYEMGNETSSVTVTFPQIADVTADKCLSYFKSASMDQKRNEGYLEPHPFQIHGNGRAKHTSYRLIRRTFKAIPDFSV